jgi:hypothetical protein
MGHIRKRFWEAKPVKQSTRIARHQAGEERLHTHNPTQKGGVVDRHPNKRESIQHGTSRFSTEREPHTTDRKLGRSPKLKVQDLHFMKKHEETSQKKYDSERRLKCITLYHTILSPRQQDPWNLQQQ